MDSSSTSLLHLLLPRLRNHILTVQNVHLTFSVYLYGCCFDLHFEISTPTLLVWCILVQVIISLRCSKINLIISFHHCVSFQNVNVLTIWDVLVNLNNQIMVKAVCWRTNPMFWGKGMMFDVVEGKSNCEVEGWRKLKELSFLYWRTVHTVDSYNFLNSTLFNF